MSITKPPLALTLLKSPLPTLGPSTSIQAYTLICFSQPSGIKSTFTAYISLSGTKATLTTYMQSLSLKPTFEAYMQPSRIKSILIVNTIPKGYNQLVYTLLPGIKTLSSITYTQLLGIGFISAVYFQSSSIRPVHGVHNLQSAINPSTIMSTTSINYNRKLLNLIKLYINKRKYSGQNDTFMFKSGNLCKNALNSLSKNFQMNKTSGQDSFQSIKLIR